MKTIDDCAILIPIYNEASIIPSIIEKLQKLGWKNIIVVDDGSTDECEKILKNTKVYLLRHCLNRGKGAAVATGFAFANLCNFDSVITMDGDGQHDPHDCLKIYEKLKEKFDLVLGVREYDHISMPFSRRLAKKLANIFTFILFQVWVSDSQSGMRGYGKKATKTFFSQSDDYEFDTLVLSQIKTQQLSYCEISIQTIYTKYSMSKDRSQGWKNALITIKNILVSQLYA